jgi:hypothetical protein
MKKVWRVGACGTSFSAGAVHLVTTPLSGLAVPQGGAKSGRTLRASFLPPEGTIALAGNSRGKFRNPAESVERRTIARRVLQPRPGCCGNSSNRRSSDRCSIFALQLGSSGTPSKGL